MKIRPCPIFVAATCLLAFAWAKPAGAAPTGDADGGAFFESNIRPLLAEKCYACHSSRAKKVKGQLYVDSRAALLKGGESGAAIVPEHPEQSRLVEAVRYGNPDLQMPPKQKLSEEQIAYLEQWVKRGAPWPAEVGAAQSAAPAIPAFDLQQRKASHWAWQPIKVQQEPAVKDASWPVSPIDRFVLAKLEAAGIHPAPPADRRTLIRRLSFDLTGLPPTSREVQAFVDDGSPDAVAKVVDRLLASPQFGERWARHWLDLARYADSRGHEFDTPIPNAWQYRDYVTRAINADVPYDQFVTEQIAGDLLEHPRLSQDGKANESILGTGFWFLGEELHSPVDIRQDEADRMNSRLDVLTKTFLGLTVGCARCHDHKFDAISNRDYYSLTGMLISSTYRQVPFEGLEKNRQIAQQLQALRADARPKLLKLAAEMQRPGIEQTAAYLVAARDVIASRPASAAAAPSALDSERLARWVKALVAAEKDVLHPLHPFASIALPADAEHPDKFSQRVIAFGSSIDSEAKRALHGPKPSQVIVDYSLPRQGWWSDGCAFGLGPVQPGDVELASDAPLGFRLIPFAAAHRDPAWPMLHATASEQDLGTLGTFARSGRTFRTPKVKLASGNVWYLIRGSASVYANVDSHLLIEGPLHGVLLQQFKDRTDHWRWVRHDLTAYAGQRVEFEFTPVDDGPLDVAKVVECDQQPAEEPLAAEVAPLVPAIRDSSFQSVDELAGIYQKLLLEVSGTAERSTANAIDLAPLRNWMLQNADLFGTPGSKSWRRLAGAVDEVRVQQADLVKQVQTQSHLAPAMLDGNGVDESILVRGVARNSGDVAPRQFLEAIAGGSQSPYPADSSGRLRLARDILSPGDPFPARVMVNRVWHHLFGAGIVKTVDNFGLLGDRPSHPELLDYLALTFQKEQGWSVKKLIRSIVLSRTYQMSSRIDPEAAAAEQADPQDTLLHRMPVRRLEAEAIRDEILAASGRLNLTVGGPSVDVFVTPFMEGRGRPAGGPLDGDGRRSLYIKIRRNFLSPMMLAYDAPIPFNTIGRRSVSNVPAQALILMNDPFVVQQSHVWSRRMLAELPGDPSQRITAMYLQAFSRLPTTDESGDALAFLKQMAQAYGLPADRPLDDERVWADFGHVLFNVKEFVFIR